MGNSQNLFSPILHALTSLEYSQGFMYFQRELNNFRLTDFVILIVQSKKYKILFLYSVGLFIFHPVL
jgi:hypothetical protein